MSATPSAASRELNFDFSATDYALMARALRLAARGLHSTQPNPRVGCVIARDGEIVGEGWHRQAGQEHAETIALRAAGARARGATVYVTLEPCSHQGRTPPCADALIEAGATRVVVAAEDPNPKVAGAGVQRLRAAAIDVQTGLLRESARELNRGFFSRFERGRPWLRVKLAMSLDGRTALANGESRWITGAPARADVQVWRARSSAILTAAGTARVDDPRLTVRLPEAHAPAVPPAGPVFTPLRVLLDARLDAVSASAQLLDGSVPTLVLHAPDARPGDARYRCCELASVAVAATGRFELAEVLRVLAARGVNELQVEAGPTLCGALFAAGLVDECLLYVAPTLLGDTALPLLNLPPLAAIRERSSWRSVDERRVGEDRRILFRPT